MKCFLTRWDLSLNTSLPNRSPRYPYYTNGEPRDRRPITITFPDLPSSYLIWKYSIKVVITPVCHVTVESRLGKIHSNFHPFGVDKVSTKLAWKLNH